MLANNSRKFRRLIRPAMGLSFALVAGAAQATVIYSNLPTVLPGNLPSWGYQATQTSEMGDQVQFAPGARRLNSATVTMSNWAQASGSSDPGYNHNLTFSIYSNAANAAAGVSLATLTQSSLVPWRPAADAVNCTGANAGKWYSAADGACYNGFAFNVTFDFSAQNVMLPDEIVFGLSYNTQTYGKNPIGTDGPYNSLNYAFVGGPPSVGTDVDEDSLFLNTLNPGNLISGTVGVFGADSGWTGPGYYYAPAVSFDATAVPEPGSLALAGLALGGLAWARRRRQG